jgi:hypothetical protein
MNVSHIAHDVEMVRVHPSGDEEWYCPVCREHFLLCMPSKTNALVQTGSDSKASKKEKNSRYRCMARIQTRKKCFATGSFEDPYLEPWQNYLKNR